jgi:hypothetical protein
LISKIISQFFKKYEERRFYMKKPCMLPALIALLVLMGCATQSQFLNTKQPMATETVLNRARFEMNCPTATATIISQEVIQPALQGPWVNGIQRAEYTVGVAGCGQRHTYVVICPEGGEGCYAAGPGPFHSGF